MLARTDSNPPPVTALSLSNSSNPLNVAGANPNPLRSPGRMPKHAPPPDNEYDTMPNNHP